MKTIGVVSEILERAKRANNIATDSDLAQLMGISRSTISNWKTRETIDYELLFSVCEQADLNWIINGKANTTHESNIDAKPNELQYLVDKVVSQAEEIGKLKGEIERLEKEKESNK
ncbi:MAG: helix-turn-helix domain-containing protein [Rikenellaceae bacterium]